MGGAPTRVGTRGGAPRGSPEPQGRHRWGAQGRRRAQRVARGPVAGHSVLWAQGHVEPGRAGDAAYSPAGRSSPAGAAGAADRASWLRAAGTGPAERGALSTAGPTLLQGPWPGQGGGRTMGKHGPGPRGPRSSSPSHRAEPSLCPPPRESQLCPLGGPSPQEGPLASLRLSPRGYRFTCVPTVRPAKGQVLSAAA